MLLVRCAALGGEPRKPETPLEKARRLAASKEKKDSVQAFRWFKALGKPGTARGDEALFRYAELCLRFHAEGERGTLAEARRAFTDLKEKAGSRWGLRGKVGLLRILAIEGKRDEAIKGFDQFLAQQTKCERAVEAAYYLGCIFAEKSDDVGELRKAQKALVYSLALHKAVSKYNLPIVETRTIRAKLAEAKRMIEIKKYGKGWVLYRDAEAKRRSRKAYLEAYLAYDGIKKEFPKTVWSEAAMCYSIKCLLALAEPENAKKANRAVATIKRRLAENKELLRDAERSISPVAARKEIKDAIRKIEARVARMKAVPTGKKAAMLAERTAEKFIKENEFGLYRGEILVDLGDFYFEVRLVDTKAAMYFERANSWLEHVVKVDREIGVFDVPGKARKVAVAPPARYRRDGWGNIGKSRMGVGAIVNRRQAPWYLDDLCYRMNIRRGVLYYLYGKMEKARTIFLGLRKYDARCRLDEKEIWGSTAQRLAAAAEDKLGPRAENEFLRVFRGKRQLAALLGNFAYDALDFRGSEAIYLRLLKGEFGKLSREEEAYVRYLLGNIKHMQGREKESIRYLSVFEDTKFIKTRIYPKALYTLCAIAVQCRMDRDGKFYDKIWKRCFPLLQERGKGTKFAEQGLFYHAFVLEDIDWKKAKERYIEYLRRYPRGQYREIVLSHLAERRSKKEG